ncbi:hypothetical protein [Aureivirga marina]|uniref:hypothetical protein n=1 Tax=Aureivirga marina TaxID=1182451 RepID=UPI0018CB84CF|nr:hypothetical protein [Aureivirga marina]
MEEKRYKYGVNIRKGISSFLFFGFFSFIFFYLAWTNEKELSILGYFTFSKNGATYFYYTLFSLCFVFVGFAIFAVYKTKFTNREVILTENYINAPKNEFSNKTITIEFKNITKFIVEENNDIRSFKIKTDSQKLQIIETLISTKKGFEEIAEFVHERVKI